MSEKFSLKWNDYHSNWSTSLSKLRNEKNFADVTLVTEDKVKFTAHKVLLSSCSNMFNFILKENTNFNTLLYLNGVNSVNLGSILDYIYHGEVSLYQDNLNSFLESAQKLEIEGLLGLNEDSKKEEQESNIEHLISADNDTMSYQLVEEKPIIKVKQLQESRKKQAVRTLYGKSRINVEGMTTEEIDITMKELYKKIDGVWSCMECHYTTGKISHIKYHIENHVEGLIYTCNFCNDEFRSKNILTLHKNKFHKK